MLWDWLQHKLKLELAIHIGRATGRAPTDVISCAGSLSAGKVIQPDTDTGETPMLLWADVCVRGRKGVFGLGKGA